MTSREIAAVRAACRRRSWDDDTDDASRMVLERAGDAIGQLRRRVRALGERLARQAIALERAELDAEVMRRIGGRPDEGL
jgi:hypothetical protein